MLHVGDIVCTLLGCEGVRLYHDNCLSRAPGSKHTRWHCDDGPGKYMAMQPHARLGQRAVTVWYPLQGNTTPEKGSLIFASLPTMEPPNIYTDDDTDESECSSSISSSSSHKHMHHQIDSFHVASMEGCPSSEQSDEYDEFVTNILEKHQCTLSSATFELGDISIHYTDCFHTSGPNLTNSPRMIIGVTYFADGTTLRVENVSTGSSGSGRYSKFCPGVQVGEVIASKLNPLLQHCA
jgi:hypothetical protein